ncbi:methyltransferase domain-containing protein [Pedobacter sp. N36a]|nr:methyltransferase domain-containing protein [Pedobacter sp. N36a]
MLKEALAYENENLHFDQLDIKDKIQSGEKYDLIFSNAALQWLDQQEQLWPEMITMLNPGGKLLVQIPSNHDHFTLQTLRGIARENPFKAALKGWERGTAVLDIGADAQLLFKNGAKEMTIYEKVYPHILADANAIFEWTSGTAMIPYLEHLPEDFKLQFANEYKNRLQQQYPEKPVFYPFKRTLMSGVF